MSDLAAAPLPTDADDFAAHKYLIFELAGGLFGLEVMRVREIAGMYPVTATPYVEPSVLGVINLRGKVVPVVDLRMRFGLAPRPPAARSSTIVVEINADRGPTLVGLIVDAVLEVAEIAAASIEAAPAFPGGETPAWIRGLAKTGGSVTILLHIEGALERNRRLISPPSSRSSRRETTLPHMANPLGPPSPAGMGERVDQLALEMALVRGWSAEQAARVGADLEAVRSAALSAGWAALAEHAGELSDLAWAASRDDGVDTRAAERRVQAGVIALQRKLALHRQSAAQAPPPEPAHEPAHEAGALALDDESLRDFLQESREHLAALETELLELERRPGDSELINGLFRRFHTIKGLAGFVGLRPVGECAHAAEDILRSLRDEARDSDAGCIDLLLAAADYLGSAMNEVEQALAAGRRPVVAEPGALLDRLRGRPTPAPTPGPAETAAPGPAETARPRAATAGASALRVRTDKLDSLIESAGELVIAQAMVRLDPTLQRLHTPELAAKLSRLTQLTQEVQTAAMSLRLTPLGALFDRAARLVRDLARQSGKSIRLEHSGGEAEVDKAIAEGLADALLHLVRNAVDHGVEPPEERARCGKSPEATIRIQAIQGADRVLVEIRDDGRGIDCGKVRDKAVACGLIDAAAELSQDQIRRLIFEPGLSTAAEAGELSGRGVGMDAVLRSVQELRGAVELEPEPGGGTLVRLLIPLTLVMLDGLVLGVGERRYVAPLFAVREIFRPSAAMLSRLAGGGETALLRGSLLPIARLHELFGITPRTHDLTQSLLVACESENGPYCLAVDELHGKQEVVIKSLGGYLPQIPGVAGASILGDGSVGLILDPPALARQAGIQARDWQ